MKRKEKKRSQESGSLVPEIEREEDRLAEYMQQGREEADARVQKAGTEAQQRRAAAADQLKKTIAEERERRAAEIRSAVERDRVADESGLEEFARSGRSRIERAVGLLISHVFEEVE